MTAPATCRASEATRRRIGTLKASYPLWARTCYRIRDKAGRIRPLELNPLQERIGAIEQEELRTKGEARLYVLKARQGGVSTDQQGRNFHAIWSQPGFDALTLAHETDATDKLFEITRRAVEHFPPALLPQLGPRETREISFPGLDTHFFTGTAGAKRIGRGLTIKRLHGSEFAHWTDPAGTLGTVTPGLVPAGSVVVLETTGSGLDSPGHVFWQEALGRGYRTIFSPWWECDPVHYRLVLLATDELGQLEPDEHELMARHGLDLEQIKWRRHKMAELSRPKFLVEYAEDEDSCWETVGGLYYESDLVAGLLRQAPTPIRTDRNGALEVYADLPAGERAIIGCDTSEGAGQDSHAIAARAFPSWRLLAGFKDATIPPEELAGVLNTMGRELGGALLVVEKNMHGITVLRKLRDTHDYPVDRIYHRIPLDKGNERHGDRIGWATTGETQPLLLDAGRELLMAAARGTAGIPSRWALREALAVRRDQLGKVSLNGKDMLVAEMLAWVGRSMPVADRGGASAAL